MTEAMKKGDILTVVSVVEEGSGVLVTTDSGHLLGVVKAKEVPQGTKMQVGPVCGDWCKVHMMGETYQAQILQRSVKSS